MASGPYQSKFLRLVFGQYQKSRVRYQQAARRTRMAAVKGAVVGGTWLLIPIQGLLRLSEQLTGRWKQMTASSRTRQPRLPDVDEAVSQVVSSIGACLSTQQRKEIQVCTPASTHEPIHKQVSTHKAEQLELFINSADGSIIKRWLSRLSRRLGQIRPNHVRQITGFASDIETRDTVLILDYTTVWNGLGNDQQQIIRSQIARLLTEYEITQATADNYETSWRSLSTAGIKKRSGPWMIPLSDDLRLAPFTRSFWVDVLWAVVHRKRRKQKPLSSSRRSLPGQPSFWGNAIAQVTSFIDQGLSIQQSKEIQRVQQISEPTTALLKLPVFIPGFGLIKRWVTGLSLRTSWMTSKQKSQITGFASDLKTRNTVLIFDNKIVWDGLCNDQQEMINRKIAALVFEGEAVQIANSYDITLWSGLLAENTETDDSARRYSLKGEDTLAQPSGLVQPIRSFWVEVLWAVVQRNPQKEQLSLPFWRKRLQAGQRSFWNTLTGNSRGISLFTRGLFGRMSLPILKAANSSAHSSPDIIEADVVSSSYVEQPLERLLKWLDRGFLYLEQQIQRLIDWIRHLGQA